MHKVGPKIWTLLLILLLLPTWAIEAQEEPDEEAEPAEEFSYYTLGQQTIAFSAGLFIPLFFHTFGGEVISDTNLSLGGFGSLQWGAHLGNHWLLGIELGGMFSRSIRKNFLFMVPITARVAYIFHLYPFEFPVFFGAGMNILRYESQTNVDLILKPGFSTLWKATSSWGFGLNFVYWWDFQPWRHDPTKARMGHFLEISATAQYTF